MQKGERVTQRAIPALTQAEVLEARKLYTQGSTYLQLAKRYDVSINTIWKYINNPDKAGS